MLLPVGNSITTNFTAYLGSTGSAEIEFHLGEYSVTEEKRNSSVTLYKKKKKKKKKAQETVAN